MEKKANENYYDMLTAMLERRHKVILPTRRKSAKADPETTDQIIATASHILLSCGYVMSDDLVKELRESKYSKKQLQEVCEKIVYAVKQMTSLFYYRPFYPNFPTEVMEASDAELIINAILHYVTDGKLIPGNDSKNQLIDIVSKKQKLAYVKTDIDHVIGLGTIQEFMDIAKNLIGSGTSISESDKAVIRAAIRYDMSVVPHNALLIPFKENRAVVVAEMLRSEIYDHPLYSGIDSVTDLLRIAVALSDGDISLKEPSFFRSFGRKIRRWFMDMFECIPGAITEDMLKHRERWLRFGERVHPASFNSEEYPRTIDAFAMLRNDPKRIIPFTSQIEKYYSNGASQTLINELSDRPGYFARELHHMMKAFPARQFDIAVGFARIAYQVSIPVLYQVKSFYESKMYLCDEGIYFPKGTTQNVFVKQNKSTTEIPDSIANIVVAACQYGIETQLTEKNRDQYNDQIKVWIDRDLGSYLIPNSQRSAGKALKTIARGSRIEMKDAACVRAFIHWVNTGKKDSERTDIDLSVAFMDQEFKIKDRTSYYELRNAYSCHSGDYVDAPAPNGASEFIDIHLNKAIDAGIKYAAITVHSYTLQKFYEIPECCVGYMLLNEKDMEEQYAIRNRYADMGDRAPVFIPENVEMTMQIGSDSQYVTVCVIDLDSRDIIWCDLAGNADRRIYLGNNVDTSANVLSYMAKSVVNSKRETLLGLAKTVARARGYQIVSDPKDADLIYAVNDPGGLREDQKVIHAYDMDEWQSML